MNISSDSSNQNSPNKSFANPSQKKRTTQESNQKKPKSKFQFSPNFDSIAKSKLVLGGVFFVLLLVGTGAAFHLSKTSQDIRQQAYIPDEYCRDDDDCPAERPNCIRGVCFPEEDEGDVCADGPTATNCASSDTSCGTCEADTSLCWDNNGTAQAYCIPICNDQVSQACSFECTPCGNPKTCYPEGSPTPTKTTDNSPTPTSTGTLTPTPNERSLSGQVYCQDGPPPWDVSENENWQRLEPHPDNPEGILPWTYGGPTAGWQNIVDGTVTICNSIYCWQWDMNAGDWVSLTPTDISQDADTSPGLSWRQVQSAPDGTLPWSGGGPNAGWQNEEMGLIAICNGKWCWNWDMSARQWSNTAPDDISQNETWQQVQPAPDGSNTLPWSGNGPTSGWQNKVADLVAVCNGKWCWNWVMSAGEWQNLVPTDISQHSAWKPLRPSPDKVYPWSDGGPTAGWQHEVMDTVAVLNTKWVWNWDMSEGAWNNPGPVHPLPDIVMDIIRNSLGNTTATTDTNGFYSSDLTGETGQFAVRAPNPLPDRTLDNGMPYSAFGGPIIYEKSQCNTGYEQCDAQALSEHNDFDFRYTNCAPPMCLDLLMTLDSGDPIPDVNDVQPGTGLEFTCQAERADLVTRYEFRVILPDNSIFDIPDTQVSNDKATYTVPDSGDVAGEYTVECRICDDIFGCEDWQVAP